MYPDNRDYVVSDSVQITGGEVLYDASPHCADLFIEDGVITDVGPSLSPRPGLPALDASGLLLLPGFLDLHTHGAAGVDANNATPAALHKIALFFASQGVTGFLPTVLTDTSEHTLHCIRQVKNAVTIAGGARILGIHLEGPFLCADYKGAMPAHLLRLPNIGELQGYRDAAGGLPLRMTISPELPGAAAFIAAAVRLGVQISLGHTGADYDTAWQCIRAGATSATHTLNAMRLPHQHAPAVSGAVLESDCFCEIIPDGLHLHPGMVRLLIKTKGWDRIVVVTDSIMAAGLGDGKFHLGVNDIVVKDGDARLAVGDSRAGSTLTMAAALRKLSAFTGEPLHKFAPLLSSNAASLMGFSNKGRISPGFDGDIVALNQAGEVAFTVVEGAIVYQKGWK